MKPILQPDTGIEFSYDEDSKHSYFEVAFVKFASNKRVRRKFPLSISSAELRIAISETVLPTKSSEIMTPDQLMWHSSVYEDNIYYLRTLLHDAKLQAFSVWLLEWYVRSFFLSLALLLGNRRHELTPALAPDIPEVLQSVLEISNVSQVKQRAGAVAAGLS
jgi:hypothetical protein